jgi:hypothetical protein
MLPFAVTLPAQPSSVPRVRSAHSRQNLLTPLFVAFPYVSAVSPLSTAFTHSDRGGRVPISPAFRRSGFSTCRLSSTISRIFNSLLPLVPLFAPLFSLVSFIFSSLRTLFCTYRGWPPLLQYRNQAVLLSRFADFQTFKRSDLQTFRSPVPKSKLLTGGEGGKRRGIAPGAER